MVALLVVGTRSIVGNGLAGDDSAEDNLAEGDSAESVVSQAAIVGEATCLYLAAVVSEAAIVGEVTFLYLAAAVAKAWSTRLLRLPVFLMVIVLRSAVFLIAVAVVALELSLTGVNVIFGCTFRRDLLLKSVQSMKSIRSMRLVATKLLEFTKRGEKSSLYTWSFSLCRFSFLLYHFVSWHLPGVSHHNLSSRSPLSSQLVPFEKARHARYFHARQ